MLIAADFLGAGMCVPATLFSSSIPEVPSLGHFLWRGTWRPPADCARISDGSMLWRPARFAPILGGHIPLDPPFVEAVVFAALHDIDISFARVRAGDFASPLVSANL